MFLYTKGGVNEDEEKSLSQETESNGSQKSWEENIRGIRDIMGNCLGMGNCFVKVFIDSSSLEEASVPLVSKQMQQ